MSSPIAILLLSTESVAQLLHDLFSTHRPDLKPGESFPRVRQLWLGKQGKSEFEFESLMWRKIAEDFIVWLQRQLGNAAMPHPLAAELMPVGHAAKVQPLKNASGDIAADIASQEVRAAIQAEENSAILQGRIVQLTSEVQDLNARLIDRTAEAAQLADRAKRAEAERDRKREAETKLIVERDRLIHVDIARLREEIEGLSSELESARMARKLFSDQSNKAAEELSACMERERRLTERLAQIAGIVSDL